MNTTVHPIHWPADDLQAWSEAADAFAQGQLGGAAQGHEHHADAAFPAVLDALRHMGFADLCSDERLGGLVDAPHRASALARVLEPLCAVDASAGAAVYAQAAAHLALCASGLSNAQVDALAMLHDTWLAWPAFHEVHEQAWPAVSEDNGTARLSGPAEMLLPGTHARLAVLPAREGKALRLVLVDLAQAGVTRSLPVRTLGLSACGVADLGFAQVPCTVLASDALAVVQAIEPTLAAATVAMQCGVMRGSLQVAQTYAAERYQGGGNLLGWGEVRRLLSLMHERLGAAVGQLGQALHLARLDTTACNAASANYAALHVGTLACEQTTDGVQLLGGNGYMKDYGQEKRMRDARQLQGLLGGVAWRRQRLVGRVLAAA